MWSFTLSDVKLNNECTEYDHFEYDTRELQTNLWQTSQAVHAEWICCSAYNTTHAAGVMTIPPTPMLAS